jgi:hypothetical protein
LNNKRQGCEFLVAYARLSIRAAKQEQATLQFITTVFTCIVLTVLFIVFNNDTETIVIKPIKKVVDIIERLAESPLKKPTPPNNEEEQQGF